MKNVNQKKDFLICASIILGAVFLFSSTASVAQKTQNESVSQETKKEIKPYTPTENEKHYLNELMNRSNGLLKSGFWSQKESTWIQVNSHTASDIETCRELADTCATYLSKAVGHFLCVRLYYGNLRQVARSCNSPR